MAIYVIGDVQGCYDELQQLLERIAFDQTTDRLWFTGDLVNRGPKSLEVLRFVRSLGDRAISVLGNHDLHLLAVAAETERARTKDTLGSILRATDREELIDWLRTRPLLHHDEALSYTIIHAGLPPQWDLGKARACAAEVEAVLQGPQVRNLLANMYGDQPVQWNDTLVGWDRLRFIINCFTRLRYCGPNGQLILKEKGPPGSQPSQCTPWFRVPGRATAGARIVFGHWSTLGYVNDDGILAMDTGCLWGGWLTAQRLDAAERPWSIKCPGARKPGGE